MGLSIRDSFAEEWKKGRLEYRGRSQSALRESTARRVGGWRYRLQKMWEGVKQRIGGMWRRIKEKLGLERRRARSEPA